MNGEVVDLAKHLECLNMDEDQVFRLAHSFKHLNIDQRRPTSLRQVHDLVMHISQCRTPRCKYQYCHKVKAYFRHSALCKKRAAGGCYLCKNMCKIFQHYSQACKESNCNKVFCSVFKKCRIRAQKQSDSRRGGAEVAGRDLKECQGRAQDSEQLGAKFAEVVNFLGTPEQLKKILDLVLHISQCRSACCSYVNCTKAKGLLTHSSLCKTGLAGGCHLCKNWRRMIHLHAAACKKSNCNVPRCRDVKERLLHVVSLLEAAVEVDCSS